LGPDQSEKAPVTLGKHFTPLDFVAHPDDGCPHKPLSLFKVSNLPEGKLLGGHGCIYKT
jgi:hypothetical protein